MSILHLKRYIAALYDHASAHYESNTRIHFICSHLLAKQNIANNSSKMSHLRLEKKLFPGASVPLSHRINVPKVDRQSRKDRTNEGFKDKSGKEHMTRGGIIHQRNA